MSQIKLKQCLIDGQNGKLEVALDWPDQFNQENPVVIICHPHPLFQGTMQNKVVTTISKAFQKLDLLAIRFNYRGVGKSEGKYDQGEGEVDDLISVVSWLRNQNLAQKIILAGFSFGGAIAYKGANKIDNVTLLLTVAPSVINFKVNQIKEPNAPLTVILSDDDEVVDAKDTLNWLTQEFKNPFHLIKFTHAGHFFHGRLIELREELINHYTKRI